MTDEVRRVNARKASEAARRKQVGFDPVEKWAREGPASAARILEYLKEKNQ